MRNDCLQYWYSWRWVFLSTFWWTYIWIQVESPLLAYVPLVYSWPTWKKASSAGWHWGLAPACRSVLAHLLRKLSGKRLRAAPYSCRVNASVQASLISLPEPRPQSLPVLLPFLSICAILHLLLPQSSNSVMWAKCFHGCKVSKARLI